MTLNAVEMAGIKKSYGGIHALKGVDLTVRAGTIHALVGENGAGKSTLLKILQGVAVPNEGSIRILGTPLEMHTADAARRAGLGMIFQELSLVPTLSVAENIFLNREPLHHAVTAMLLGVIADDFTGASDIANTLAKGWNGQGGLRTTQYLGVPGRDAAPDVEAGVVSLKSRSIRADEAVRRSLARLDWLKAQGCRQFVFKYCSTFDSTPEGNIGPVADALAEALDAHGVVVCPAFPGTGRTVYAGHLFVGDRLLSESGMQNHPLNPMTDPDIRRWLGHQAKGAVGLVPSGTVRTGASAVRSALAEAGKRGERLVVVDATSDEDLVTIGKAAANARLVTGGSGIAIGLPANFIRAGLAAGSGHREASVTGPEAILAGSCSGATRGQIDLHARAHPVLAIDVDSVMRNETGAGDVVAFVRANEGRAPLAYSSGTPEEVRRLQDAYGRETVAERLDALFADTARQLVDGGVRRLVVAGGETSGAVVSALGLEAMAIGPEIDPGVPVLVDDARGLALALKSGNFGAPDFFAKALDRLGGAA